MIELDEVGYGAFDHDATAYGDPQGNLGYANAAEADGAGTDAPAAFLSANDSSQCTATVAVSDIVLGPLTLQPASVGGAHVVNVHLPIEELAGNDVGDGELWISLEADPHNTESGVDEDNAERRASVQLDIPAIAGRGKFDVQLPMQVDAGHWHVTATLWSKGSTQTAPLDKAEGDVTVQGHHARRVVFDPDIALDLAVVVTGLTRVGPTLYEVHFVLGNLSATAPVPAGLPVIGVLTSDATGMTSSQDYDMPASIRAGASSPNYLTLEGAATGTLTASITVNPAGSNRFDSVPLVIDASAVQARTHNDRNGGVGHHHDAHPASTPQQDSAGEPASDSDHRVEFEANETLEKIEEVLDNTHRIADVSEALALLTSAERLAEWAKELQLAGEASRAVQIAGGLATALEVTSEILEPIGDVALMIIVAIEIHKANHAGLTADEGMGFCYGAMWEIFGYPNYNREFKEWAGDTVEERREAFYDGVAQGRSKAQATEVHNRAMLQAGNLMRSGWGTAKAAQFEMFNELWQETGHKLGIRNPDAALDFPEPPPAQDMDPNNYGL